MSGVKSLWNWGLGFGVEGGTLRGYGGLGEFVHLSKVFSLYGFMVFVGIDVGILWLWTSHMACYSCRV